MKLRFTHAIRRNKHLGDWWFFGDIAIFKGNYYIPYNSDNAQRDWENERRAWLRRCCEGKG